jgi:hypothetical protein
MRSSKEDPRLLLTHCFSLHFHGKPNSYILPASLFKEALGRPKVACFYFKDLATETLAIK